MRGEEEDKGKKPFCKTETKAVVSLLSSLIFDLRDQRLDDCVAETHTHTHRPYFMNVRTQNRHTRSLALKSKRGRQDQSQRLHKLALSHTLDPPAARLCAIRCYTPCCASVFHLRQKYTLYFRRLLAGGKKEKNKKTKEFIVLQRDHRELFSDAPVR